MEDVLNKLWDKKIEGGWFFGKLWFLIVVLCKLINLLEDNCICNEIKFEWNKYLY